MEGILFGDGAPRRVSGEDIRNLLGGSDRLSKLLGDIASSLPNCGDPACPIHSDSPARPADDGRFSSEQLATIDAEGAVEFAVAATAGAHNAIADGKWSKAEVLQSQADLWLRVHEVKVQQESIAQMREQEARLLKEGWGQMSPDPEPETTDPRDTPTGY